jgi:hypothetical protein
VVAQEAGEWVEGRPRVLTALALATLALATLALGHTHMLRPW